MMTESRRAFEALARDKGWDLSSFTSYDNPPEALLDRYVDDGTQAAFEAWESGRLLLGLEVRALEVAANTAAHCYAHRPENFGAALTALDAEAERARELLNEVKA